jgi:hypothetical protein
LHAVNTTCDAPAWSYNVAMANKIERNSRRTTLVPITTFEEVPALSPEERADLIDSLEAAEARIDAGDFFEYDPETFEDRLLNKRSNSQR